MAQRLNEWPASRGETAWRDRARTAADRVAELERAWPLEWHGAIRLTVANEMSLDPSTVSKLLKHPDRAPGTKGSDRDRPRRRDYLWTPERIKRAISAWWDRHGEPPSAIDWSPSELRRRRARSTVESRLAAHAEGWIDLDGVRRPFPSARSIPLRPLVEEVRSERLRWA